MNLDVINGLLIGITSTAAVTVIIRTYESRREGGELQLLRNGIKSPDSAALSPGTFQLKTRAGRETAAMVSLLLARIRDFRRGSAEFSDLVLVSRQIAAGTDTPEQMAALALRLLADQAGPDIVGAMLFRKMKQVFQPDGANSRGRIETWVTAGVTGSPQLKRTIPVLHSALDRLEYRPSDPADAEGSDLQWGYVVPRAGDDLDLSVFGIGMSLFVPLIVDRRLTGAVWLGFRTATSGIGAERKRLIRALAEHLAASFESAEAARSRTNKAAGERDFLVGLSHDLRTPSTVALLAVQEILLDQSAVTPADFEDRLQTIDQCLREQLGMLDDILDLSRHRYGLIAVRPVNIDRTQVEDIVWSFLPLARKKGIELKMVRANRSDGQQPLEYAVADSNHFRRIVQNLISNAIKYTDSGTITVRFHTSGEKQLVEVEDTGRGIEINDRQRLFQPFSRPERSFGGEGAGIGLAISKILAELNGGSLRHVDRPGGGSIFTLALTGTKSSPATSSAAGLNNLRYNTALIVDDDQSVRRMVRRNLEGMAIRILEAESLAQAVNLAADERPDLIISDYLLGDGTAANLFTILNSLERCRQVQDLEFNCVHTNRQAPARNVVISGGGLVPAIISDLSIESEIRLLQKPFNREQLIRAIFE